MSLPIEHPIEESKIKAGQTVTTIEFKFSIYSESPLPERRNVTCDARDALGNNIPLPSYTIAKGDKVGGAVTFSPAFTPAIDCTLRLTRTIPLEQETYFSDDGNIKPKDIMTALDITNARIQDINAGDGVVEADAVRLPSDSKTSRTIPDGESNKLKGLAYSSDGLSIIARDMEDNDNILSCVTTGCETYSQVYFREVKGVLTATMAIAAQESTLSMGTVVAPGFVKRAYIAEHILTDTGVILKDGDMLYLSGSQAGRVTNIPPGILQVVGQVIDADTGQTELKYVIESPGAANGDVRGLAPGKNDRLAGVDATGKQLTETGGKLCEAVVTALIMGEEDAAPDILHDNMVVVGADNRDVRDSNVDIRKVLVKDATGGFNLEKDAIVKIGESDVFGKTSLTLEDHGVTVNKGKNKEYGASLAIATFFGPGLFLSNTSYSTALVILDSNELLFTVIKKSDGTQKNYKITMTEITTED